MNVAFRVDASRHIGGGHVMRCLTLADELARQGAACMFAAASITEPLAERIVAAGHRLALLGGSPNAGMPADVGAWPDARQQLDASRFDAALGAVRPRWIVVDHYNLGAAWEAAARSGAPRIGVIDDLADRGHDCDLLLDTTIGRTAADYKDLLPSRCVTLLGPPFALLRAEFAEARPHSIERRTAAGGRHLLISLGMTDVGGVTLDVLEAAMTAAGVSGIDVVYGDADAASLPAARRAAATRPDVSVHCGVNGRQMVELLTRCDLAIGAAGTSNWERCCLGVPTIALVLADNQKLIARRLEEAAACTLAAAAGGTELTRQVEGLIADAPRLAAMTAASAALTEGSGAAAIATLLIGGGEGMGRRVTPEDIVLRRAEPPDSLLIWSWRNDPVTRGVSRSSAPLPWADHQNWFARTLSAADRELVIAQIGHEPAGVLRFDAVAGDDHRWEVSINLGPRHRGGGAGGAVLAAGCARFRSDHPDARLEAAIRQDNAPSRRIFEAVGFRWIGSDEEPDFDRFALPHS